MHISPRGLLNDLRTNLKPRELFYWCLGNGVYLAFRLSMRVELHGMAEHFSPSAPSTLVIGAHKRDWDPILFAAYGHYPQGWLAPNGHRMAFTGRSDLWEPGFLATVVSYKGWPLWLQHLLDPINFTPVANLMRGYPILRIPEYTLRQYLRAVLKDEGDLPLEQVLSERTLALFAQGEQMYRQQRGKSAAGGAGALTVSQALRWAYHPLTRRSIRAGMLASGRYERLREAWRVQVGQQMDTLARVIERGDPLWFSPEGAVSLDGRPLRLRSGLHTLLAKVGPEVRCLPANFAYDFMASKRRMIVCVGVGPALKMVQGLEQGELSERVAPTMTRQTVVTMSQLGSARLMAHLAEQHLAFDPQEELPILAAQVRRLAELGAIIQRDLLSERELRERLRAFLGYCQKHGLLLPEEGGRYRIVAEAITGTRSSTFWENPVRYSANELAALEEALQPPVT
ncbi:MAG TPA: hypothetical protein VH590_17745, partial [Ktedonobacterales bacterium]